MNNENVKKVDQNKMENDEIDMELYFLIASFLKNSQFHESAKILDEEIKSKNMLPARCDIYGNVYPLEYDEMKDIFKHLAGNHLSKILHQAVRILRSPTKTECVGLTSLLSSAFPTKDTNSSSSFINFNLTPRNIIDGIFNQQYGNIRHLNYYNPKKNIFSGIKMHKRIVGHLASVYCVIFDHTGDNIITGSDDKLIKIWKSRNGFLVSTLRGHTAEICDLAINANNTILASCSCDKSVRIWQLKSTAQLAVLIGHSGAVTSIKFCSYKFDTINFLISTGNDASVCFWKFSDWEFDPEPIKFNEKIRHNSQLLCSSFSPGGNYLIVGSTDSVIYVFEVTENDVVKILELEEHTDRVDTIEFSHNGERFISSSRDGTARIWYPKAISWSSNLLKPYEAENLTDDPDFINKVGKIKILTVTWNLSDIYIIGSCTDHYIKIWCSASGDILHSLKAHTDSIFVLECHSTYPNVFLSAGHDGLIVVWEINNPKPLNIISNQLDDHGTGAIFDAKFSPNDCMIAATDSHGHLCIVGYGSGEQYKISPDQQFFHTDYRPIYSEEDNVVYDEQTGMLPHTMPPPILVDMDGNPHSLTYQNFLLGRKSDFLSTVYSINGDNSKEVKNTPTTNMGVTSVPGLRSIGDVEGVRHTGNIYFSISLSDSDVRRWKRRTIVKPLDPSKIFEIQENIDFLHNHEIEYFKNIVTNCDPVDLETEERKSKLKTLRAKVIRKQLNEQSENPNQNNLESNPNHNLSPQVTMNSARTRFHNEISSSESPPISSEEASMSDDEYTEYSDNIEYSIRRKISTRRNDYGVDEVSRTSNSDELVTSEEESETFSQSYLFPQNPLSINGILLSANWIVTEKPNRSPYYPQVGDIVIYLLQGHKAYVNCVTRNKLYTIIPNKLCYNKTSLRPQEVCRVANITYIRGYPYLCSLTLNKLDTNGAYSTGVNFSVQYTEIPNVDDFLILKQFYDSSLTVSWHEGQNFRSYIDDEWWMGTILEIKPYSQKYKDCPFKSISIKWDTGEVESLSPWDIFKTSETNRDASNFNYIPTEEDWGDELQSEAYQRILAALETLQLMPQFKIVDTFLNEKNTDETLQIAFPTSLCKLSRRCENKFYRRKKSMLWEIRMIFSNVKSLEPSAEIYKNCEILVNVLTTCIKEITYDIADLIDRYYQESQENAIAPQKQKTNKGNRCDSDTSSLPTELLWVIEAHNILNYLMNLSDCEPFLTPVNMTQYSDYYDFIKNPLDFNTIADRLKSGFYLLPDDFVNDIKLIFSNSRLYNTNPRSSIYGMTLRLNSLFNKKIESLLPNWRQEALGSGSHITRQKFRTLVNLLDKNADSKPAYIHDSLDIPTNTARSQRRVTRSMLNNIVDSDNISQSPIKTRLRNRNRLKISHQDSSDDSADMDNREIFNGTRRSKRKIVISDSSEHSEQTENEEDNNRQYSLRSNPINVNVHTNNSKKCSKRVKKHKRRSTNRKIQHRSRVLYSDESTEGSQISSEIMSSSHEYDEQNVNRADLKYSLRSLNLNQMTNIIDQRYQSKLRKRKPTNYEEK